MTVRQDFINHLKLRWFSQCTIDNYVDNVARVCTIPLHITGSTLLIL